MTRFVKLVGSPLDGFYVKQEQDLRTIVMFVQEWGRVAFRVRQEECGEWVGVLEHD